MSLGINLLPQKICSFDCIYCEAGATEILTTERKPYVPAAEVISELKDYLKAGDYLPKRGGREFYRTLPQPCLNQKPKLDFITFSGIGEPTLNSDIGEIIRYIKQNCPEYKLCLITNSTLFPDESLHDDLALCDVIMPSLDAVSDDIFIEIDRPCKSLKTSEIIESLIKFRKRFKNQMWLEIFFLEGINDSEEELALLKEACEKIMPDKIQINSLDRAGVVDWVKKVSDGRLLEIKKYFEPFSTDIV